MVNQSYYSRRQEPSKLQPYEVVTEKNLLMQSKNLHALKYSKWSYAIYEFSPFIKAKFLPLVQASPLLDKLFFHIFPTYNQDESETLVNCLSIENQTNSCT